jgi:DeoR/GlpR family transcriptional regulator of sugar metabolism
MNLVQECGVTSQTIRRDLHELEARGLIQKGHGVALAGPEAAAIAYKDRNVTGTELKRCLTARLGEFILPGSTIYVGLGTTFNSIQEVLRDHSRVIVATNNLGVAYSCTFKTGVTLSVFGGYIRRNDTAVLASTGGGVGGTFKFDMAILGANAIDEDGGACARSPRSGPRPAGDRGLPAGHLRCAGRQIRRPGASRHQPSARRIHPDHQLRPEAKLADPTILEAVRVLQVDPGGALS